MLTGKTILKCFCFNISGTFMFSFSLGFVVLFILHHTFETNAFFLFHFQVPNYTRNGAEDKIAPLPSQGQNLAWDSIQDGILQQSSERWVAASHLDLNVGAKAGGPLQVQGQPRLK